MSNVFNVYSLVGMLMCYTFFLWSIQHQTHICLKCFFILIYVGDRKRMDNIWHFKSRPFKWGVFDFTLDTWYMQMTLELNNIPFFMCISHYLYWFMCGQTLRLFHILALVINTIMNIGVQTYVWDSGFIPFKIYPEVGLLYHMVVLSGHDCFPSQFF